MGHMKGDLPDAPMWFEFHPTQISGEMAGDGDHEFLSPQPAMHAGVNHRGKEIDVLAKPHLPLHHLL